MLDLAFITKICVRQSRSCSSWDFPTVQHTAAVSISSSQLSWLSSLSTNAFLPCYILFL